MKLKLLVYVLMICTMAGCSGETPTFQNSNINKENHGEILYVHGRYYYGDHQSGFGLFEQKGNRRRKIVETQNPIASLNYHDNMIYYLDMDENTKQKTIYRTDLANGEVEKVVDAADDISEIRKVHIVGDLMYYIESNRLKVYDLNTKESNTFDFLVYSSYEIVDNYIYYNHLDYEQAKNKVLEFTINRFDTNTGENEMICKTCSDSFCMYEGELYFLDADNVFHMGDATGTLCKLDANNQKITVIDDRIETYTIMDDTIYYIRSYIPKQGGVYKAETQNPMAGQKISDDNALFLYTFDHEIVWMTNECFVEYDSETGKSAIICYFNQE